MNRLKIEDLENYKSISELTLTPDGNHAGYVVHEAELSTNSYLTNIWVYHEKERSHKKLTSCGKAKNFFWQDNENIVFLGEKEKNHSIFYIVNIKDGERKKFLELPLSVEKVVPIDSDTFVIQGLYNHYPLDDSCEVIDEIPFWSNGKGFTNKVRSRLYIFNRNTETLIPISEPFESIKSFKVKAGKIYYSFNTYQDMMGIPERLYSYDISTKKYESLIPEDIYKIHNFDFIGQDLILAASDMKNFDLNENPTFYRVLNGQLFPIISPDLGLGNSIVSDCRLGTNRSFKGTEDGLYFISTVSSASYLTHMSSEGMIEFLSENLGSVDGFDIHGDKILFVGLRQGKLQEIYSFSDRETPLTSFNEKIISSRKFSKPEPLDFINRHGVKIEGFVMKPIDYDPCKKYPAILNIHGGPKATYGDVFCHEMQYWANRGYFVFFCNPRGSEGRGNEFADIRGKYGTIDYEDIMEFTDRVLDSHPEIDDKKVAVTGGSYGGFMVNWIIGHTDRFICAASQRSISNWISKLTTTDIGYYHNKQQQQGDPWINPDKLWYHSPLRYADKAKTPTLFIHSDEDYRCWMSEPLQMFTALKLHGVPSRICLFKGENHELSRSGKPKNRVRRIEEITNWIDKYTNLHYIY